MSLREYSSATYVVSGDFNVDLKNTHSPHTRHLINKFCARALSPSITLPTRITAQSGTVLDQIWCTDPPLASGVLSDSLVSDHLATFIRLESNAHPEAPEKITIRKLKEANLRKLKEEVEQLNFDGILAEQDPNAATEQLTKQIKTCLDTACPTRTFIPSQSPRRPPWFNVDLALKRAELCKLASKAYRRPNALAPDGTRLVDHIPRRKKEYNHERRKAKREYIFERFASISDNLKEC